MQVSPFSMPTWSACRWCEWCNLPRWRFGVRDRCFGANANGVNDIRTFLFYRSDTVETWRRPPMRKNEGGHRCEVTIEPQPHLISMFIRFSVSMIMTGRGEAIGCLCPILCHWSIRFETLDVRVDDATRTVSSVPVYIRAALSRTRASQNFSAEIGGFRLATNWD